MILNLSRLLSIALGVLALAWSLSQKSPKPPKLPKPASIQFNQKNLLSRKAVSAAAGALALGFNAKSSIAKQCAVCASTGCNCLTSSCVSCGGNFGSCSCVSGDEMLVSNDESLWYNPSNQRIFDTLHKSYVPPKPDIYLRKELDGRKVIIIGEVHSNPCHHRLQFEIIRSLATDFIPSDSLAIGLETFYRQHQRALDRFVFIHKDFDLLQKETSWKSTWGYDLNFYAKIFRFAAANNIRLVGLNAPYELARLVGEEGLDNLPDKIKPFLPDIDLSNAKHRSQFEAAIGVSGGTHGMFSKEALQHMYEAQSLWDEYMAESVARYTSAYPENMLVVIAGLGHVQGRVGIPDRISKRVQGKPPFVIVPQEVDWLDNGLPDVERPLSYQDCDWAWYTERAIPPRSA